MVKKKMFKSKIMYRYVSSCSVIRHLIIIIIIIINYNRLTLIIEIKIEIR